MCQPYLAYHIVCGYTRARASSPHTRRALDWCDLALTHSAQHAPPQAPDPALIFVRLKVLMMAGRAQEAAAMLVAHFGGGEAGGEGGGVDGGVGGQGVQGGIREDLLRVSWGSRGVHE